MSATHSRFDPLDMALGALAGGGTQGPAPAATPASPRVPSNASNTRDAAPAARPRTTTEQRSARKAQLNVYMSSTVIEQLRGAVMDLGGRYSLGDIVQHLIEHGLDQAVQDMAAAPVGTTRLRAGRRVQP